MDRRFDQMLEAMRILEGRITRLEEKASIRYQCPRIAGGFDGQEPMIRILYKVGRLSYGASCRFYPVLSCRIHKALRCA